jgi:hypothetical protein
MTLTLQSVGRGLVDFVSGLKKKTATKESGTVSVTVTVPLQNHLNEQENHERCRMIARALLGPRYRVAALQLGLQEGRITAVAAFDATAVLAEANQPISVPQRFRLAWTESYGSARPPRRLGFLALVAVLLAVASAGEKSGLSADLMRWMNDEADRIGWAEGLQSDALKGIIGRIVKPEREPLQPPSGAE